MEFSAQRLSKRDYFFSQPHQPFFLLGMINAFVFMLLFLLSYKGIIGTNALFLHSYSMIFLVFTNFFFGFLYTTFPRFSGTEPIEPRRYLIVFSLNFLATLSFLVGVWFAPALYAASFFMAASFAMTLKIFYHIYQRCTLPKRDQYWIIVALGIGAMSNLLFLLSLIPCSCKTSVFYDTAVSFGVYLYAIFLGFVVALRMVPFFSHVMEWKRNDKLHLQIFVLFVLHSFLSGLYPKALFLVDLIASLLIAYELRQIKLPFPNKEPLLWILHIALFWLALGLFVGSVVEFFESFFGWYSFKLPLHLVALGFLLTILIGFGTRVTLGHSGNLLRVDRAGVVIFYFTQVVVLGRILFSLAASFGHITPAFDISATLWMLLILAWLWRYGSVLAFGRRA
ncbi:MAG: NnrS family protein [Epsilonproteobacteria bacterium]|nr:NnrS family protein [Campylobacterota bacterium]NPA63406.1 NnrS family protein [Campylobacterota bacterium]